MAESYSVTAVLSARDKNFGSVFGAAQSHADSLAKKLSGGLGFGVLAGVGMKAFSTLTSAASGFTGELESTSAAWQTFEQNARMNGHTADEINETRKSLQDFATQTIYSASDMSTTFAQLDAVGIESAESLVKGFGGLAAAAENPAQAMKTLSQQGVQMAAKPKVAWQDFKLMLEQTPAGIAAVAKEMGMTTSQMVQAVQDGKIKTDAFFEAIQKVGTSDEFTKMATEYKTVGQAMGGLEETVTNKLLPSFSVFQDVGIEAVEAVIGKLDEIDGDAIAEEIRSFVDAFKESGITGVLEKAGGYIDKMPESIKSVAAAAGALGGMSLVTGVLNSDAWKAGVNGAGSLANAIGSLPGVAKKGFSGVTKGFTEIGYGALNFASHNCPQVLTGLSEMGDKAKGVGGTLKNTFKANTIDKFTAKFPKMTGALGKATSAVGKIGSGVIKTYGKMGSALTQTMGLALKAVMPAAVIGAALAGLGVLYSKFGTQIDGFLQMAAEKGPEVIQSFVGGITARLPELMSSGAQLVGNILTAITANLPAIIQGGVDLITGLVNGVAVAAPMLIGKGIELVGTLVVSLMSAVPQLITTGMNLLASLADGVGQNLPMLAGYAMQAIMTFAQGIIGNLPQILASAVQIVYSLVTGIVNMIPVLISSGIQLITYLAQSFIQNLPMIIQTGIQVIGALVMGLIQAVPMIIQGAIELVKSLIDTIINTDWIKVGSDIIDAIGNGIKSGFGGLGSLISGLFSNDTSAEDGGAQQATRAAESTAQAYISNSGLVSSAASQVGTEATTSLTAGLSSGAAEVSSIMSTMGTEGVTAFSASFDGISLDGVGTELSNSINTEFDSGLSQLPEITGNAGDQVVSSLKQSGSQATAAVKSTTTSVINTLKSGVSPAAAAGKSIGNGFTSGIRGASGAARSAGTALKNAGLSGMSGGYSSAYSHGANIGQGLVNGMRSKIGAAWDAAESLAAAADKAIAARAQIGSPSKISTRQGAFIGQGLGNGLADMRSYVEKRAAAVTTSAISTIDEGVQRARSSMAKLVGATAPEMEIRQRSGSMSLNDEYEYREKAHYTIVVESVMDGRKVGEVVADYVDEAITKKNARNARKRGRA